MTTPTLEAGTELASFQRETGVANWNRYAAVNDEFVPIHMDDEAGKAAGMGGAFGMGNLQLSYLHILLRNWIESELGGNGRIASLECEFRAPNTKGTVTVRGTITGQREEDGKKYVDLEISTENTDGKALAKGTAVVELV